MSKRALLGVRTFQIPNFRGSIPVAGPMFPGELPYCANTGEIGRWDGRFWGPELSEPPTVDHSLESTSKTARFVLRTLQIPHMWWNFYAADSNEGGPTSAMYIYGPNRLLAWSFTGPELSEYPHYNHRPMIRF